MRRTVTDRTPRESGPVLGGEPVHQAHFPKMTLRAGIVLIVAEIGPAAYTRPAFPFVSLSYFHLFTELNRPLVNPAGQGDGFRLHSDDLPPQGLAILSRL